MKNFKNFLVAGRLNDQDKIHADESSVNNSAGSSTDNKWVFWSCFEISDLVQFKRVSLIVLRVLSQSESVLRANRKSVSVWSNLIKTNLMNFQENLHRAVGARHLAGTVDFYLFKLFIVLMKFQIFFKKKIENFHLSDKKFRSFLDCMFRPSISRRDSVISGFVLWLTIILTHALGRTLLLGYHGILRLDFGC